MTAPLPANENERLAALYACAVLDTPPEPEYDDLTRLAARVCGTPIALVSLLDPCRQWFKARVGVDATETSRDIAFCTHAILRDDLFVVPDAALDERFRNNPLVTGAPHIRFYAGMPLTTPEGHNVGTLCVIDREPRSLTDDQCDGLRVLARQVVAQLVLRRQVESLKTVVAAKERAEAALRQSQERFRSIVEELSEGVVLLDRDSRTVLRSNRAFRDLLGYTRDELAALTQYDFVAHERGDIDDKMRLIVSKGRAVLGFRKYRRKDGSVFDVSVSGSVLALDGRAVLCLVVQDMTEQKLAEDALRASEAKFRNTVDRLAEGVFVVDAATKRFVEVNAAMSAMSGYAPAEFLALTPFDLVADETPETFARSAEQTGTLLIRDGRCDLGRRVFRRKDGSVFPVDLRMTVVPNGGAGLHAVIVRDVTEQVEYENRLFEYQSDLEDANARLKALATTDGLTGVRNRAAFDEKLAEEHARAGRNGLPLSVVLMDVDHFKLFNDTFGHPAGDEVLKAVAAAVRATARGTDFVARYGGEEFVVLLPDTDTAGAQVVAERCRRAVANARWDKRPVTVSVGVATMNPTAMTDAAGLVQDADLALYRSKQSGRNRVTRASGSTPALVVRA